MGFLSNADPREKAVNQQIQQTHNQINELYTDLGRYVKLNLKDQIQDQYVQNTAQNIDDCLARLQQLNNELNSIRGIKLCVNCSAQIPVAVSFCPSCGTKQPDNGMGMGAPMNGGMMNNGMQGGMMNNGMQGGMMNNGMNGGMPMNNMGGMQNQNVMPNQGGFAAPIPAAAPVPPRSQTGFNPASAGNSPANANKNKIGADTSTPMPPQEAPLPPLNDIPPVPPVPNAVNTEIPTVPPVPEKAEPVAPQTDPLANNTITNSEPDDEKTVAAVINEPAPAIAAEKFVFCSQCGHKESGDVAFCSQCGSKL